MGFLRFPPVVGMPSGGDGLILVASRLLGRGIPSFVSHGYAYAPPVLLSPRSPIDDTVSAGSFGAKRVCVASSDFDRAGAEFGDGGAVESLYPAKRSDSGGTSGPSGESSG